MKKNSVGIDISGLDPNFKEHSIRGIGRYATELRKYFTKNSDNLKGLDVGFFDHKDILKTSKIAKLIDYSPLGKATLKQQILYPFKLGNSNITEYSCLHFLAQTDAPSWCKKKYILTVHDLIPIVCKDLYKANNPNWRYKLARFLEHQAIKNASQILTISNNSKKDIIEHLKIPEEKIKVTYLGVDYDYFSKEIVFDHNDIKSKYNIPTENDFFLYVGGIDPRKNYSGLLNIYSKFLEQCREKQPLISHPKLVFAGKISGDKEYTRFKAIIKELNLENQIIETGFIEDSDLLKLYKSCKLFLFMSLYEGFGLTPLEALASGAVVVSSNRSAMPEVLEDAALLVDPENHKLSAEQIYKIFSEKNLYNQYQLKSQNQAKKFTWNKTGDVTLEAYLGFFWN